MELNKRGSRVKMTSWKDGNKKSSQRAYQISFLVQPISGIDMKA